MATITVSSSGHVTATGLSSFATVGSTGTAKRNWNGSIVVTFTAQPIITLGSSLSPLIPVVSSASFSVQDPPLNTLVGHINVANAPLSAMNISSGDSNHYFAVSPVTQDLRTSPTVQAVSAFYNIGVTATNAAGTSRPAAVRVAVGTAPGAFTPQSGNFQLDFDAVPTQASEDSVMGVSTSAPTGYNDMAVKVRFSQGGNIDADDSGNIYTSNTNVPYSPGLKYHFRLMIRIPTHTFDAYVTPPGQSEILFANNFGFEAFQSGVTVLGYLDTISLVGGVTVTNMILTGAPPAAPVVTNSSFNLTLPATNGQTVGTMVASGAPTSWQITGGNSSGYYAIDNTGKITVTAAGAAGLTTTSTYTLTVMATNATGSGTGTATVHAQKAQAGWPNASNTGVPAGTNLVAYAGSYNITVDGTVIDGVIFNDTVNINANNVTIKNSKTQFIPAFYGFISDPTKSNHTIQDCTIDFTGSSRVIALQFGGNGRAQILRCNISGCVIVINLQGEALVQDNYIHDLAEVSPLPADRHFDGIAFRGGRTTNSLFDHNWVVLPTTDGGTASIFIKTENGPVNGVTVQNNYLGGTASYTAYSNNQTSIPLNVNFFTNTMEKGIFGYFSISDNAGVAGYTICSGNIDATTGANVDYQ